jgi:cyclopropane fatty-acyl-phospholipid synthase-like methyltransferase
MGKKIDYVVDTGKPHLGGNFACLNQATHCPPAWEYVIEKYHVKSVLDVGSGQGHAPRWFADQGLQTYAIEGLKENVDNAIFPTELVDLTERAYTRDVDMVNCVEVVEHIEERYLDNLLTTICSGRLLFMTHAVPGQKGYHHVNCQPTAYWKQHLAERGFYPSPADTAEIQKLAKDSKHIRETGMLFIRR